MKRIHGLLAAVLLAMTFGAAAHGDEEHAKKAGPVHKEQTAWGIAGNASAVTRTVELTMTDDMRFTPDSIAVRQGETIRIVLKNRGQLLRWSPPPSFVEGFARSYRGHGGELPEDWQSWAAAFDLFNLCGLLAGSEPGSRRATDIAGRIVETLGVLS